MTDPPIAGVHDEISNGPGLVIDEQTLHVTDVAIACMKVIEQDRVTTLQMGIIVLAPRCFGLRIGLLGFGRIRIGPAQCGHVSGSTSTICCRNAAQRREASVGASRGVVPIGTGASAGAGSARRRIPRGRLAYCRCPCVHASNFRPRPGGCKRPKVMIWTCPSHDLQVTLVT